MADKTTEISPLAAKKIVEAITFKIWDAGFVGDKEIKTFAVGLAAAVRRIVLEDKAPKEIKLGQ